MRRLSGKGLPVLATLLALIAMQPLAAGEGARRGYRLDASSGGAITERSFVGRVSVVIFGFATCPDICPTMVSAAAAGVRQLGPAARGVRIVFISVDPARDTPRVLREYAEAFGSQVIAATGPKREIDRAAAAFNARYALHPDGSGGYRVSHSGYAYLLDRQGRVRRLLPPASPPARYAQEVDKLLKLPAQPAKPG